MRGSNPIAALEAGAGKDSVTTTPAFTSLATTMGKDVHGDDEAGVES